MKGLIALAVALLAGLPQDRPVFRAGTDVVVLDVVVADASGTVAPSLTPADFIVTTKKGARPIVSLEFVPTRLPVLPLAGRDGRRVVDRIRGEPRQRALHRTGGAGRVLTEPRPSDHAVEKLAEAAELIRPRPPPQPQ